MSILSSLYIIFIGPLELLYDVVYTLSYYLTNNPGISIIVLGLVINILLLPLYNRADAIQTEENEIEKKLKPGVDHIKKTFKGDEQYMVLQAYYRENNYKVLYSLRGLLPLLLEIPFFIAAYNYLSNLSVLEGASFGPINNLIKPDGLLNGINILPILMTIINIISSIIYTKGSPLKSKIQLFGIALLFLVLLYNSPSGLVIYWTLNNLFSLIKNILVKLKNSKLIISIICSTISIIGIIFILFIYKLSTLVQTIGVVFILLLLQIPLIVYLINKNKQIKDTSNIKVDNKLFYLSTLFLCLLVGLLIPSNVIASSPEEFVDVTSLVNPLKYVFHCFLLSIGTFIVWFNVYYALLDKKIKKLIAPLMFGLCGVAVVDYMFFGTNLGTLNNLLKYDEYVVFSNKTNIINILLVIIIIVTIFVVNKWINKISKLILICLSLSMIIVSTFSVRKINDASKTAISTITSTSNSIPQFNLTKNGKNVIVFMLDAAATDYLPFILYEKPELIESFDGFVYYPNTISFGRCTKVGSPVIFGGYEYTPLEMNKRNNELMKDKHNEALKVMPVLFNNIGYEVTVCDLPYANYSEIPDMSIFDEYPEIVTISAKTHTFEMDGIKDKQNIEDVLKRNLFCYSVFKISPLVIQPLIYNGGNYNDINQLKRKISQEIISMSKSEGFSSTFLNSYSFLYNLNNFTNIMNDNCNVAVFINNEATHNPSLLKEPEYEPKENIDNTYYDERHIYRKSIFGDEISFDNETQMSIYQVNMAAMIKVANWLDYLKKLEVYDNTRIIIVSDHGKSLKQFDELITDDGLDTTICKALLLVKDFNAKGFNIDNEFMTNADVPTLATRELIENPTNPFTSKYIDNEDKYNKDTIILFSDKFNLEEGCGVGDGIWYLIGKDIGNMNSWEQLEDPE